MALPTDGYRRKRLEEIRSDIGENIVNSLGQVNLEADSVFGQLVGVVSNSLSEIYQDAENVYFSQYPATAEGTSLDNAVGLIGVTRLPATLSRVMAAITGEENTVIPSNSQIQIRNGGAIFTNPSSITITRTSAVRIVFELVRLTNNADFTIIVDGVAVTVNSNMGSTLETLAAQLSAAINESVLQVNSRVILGTSIEVENNNLSQGFASSLSNNMDYRMITTLGSFQAQNTGAIIALAGTVDTILTPVSGWLSVTNLLAGVTGRARETDQELRARATLSLSLVGAGTLGSILANIRQNVQDARDVAIFENRLSVPDARGRPPHSFEVLVEGGADAEIAAEIWRVKPAGIETFGTVTVIINDSNNEPQAIRFSRPEPVYIFVRVSLTINNMMFPPNGLIQVSDAILAMGQSTNVGGEIIIQAFFCAIYAIAGITMATLTMGTSSDPMIPPTEFTSNNIILTQSQVARFSAERIQVQLA